MPKEITISHLVKSEDLNHHGTLFAGRMAEWLVEGCFIAASKLVGRPEDVVCVQIHGMTFMRSANRGDIIELRTRVASLGNKSITVYGQVLVNEDKTPAVTGMATFVTVDKQGKPYAHGITLSEEYIQQNKEIHEMAVRMKSRN